MRVSNILQWLQTPAESGVRSEQKLMALWLLGKRATARGVEVPYTGHMVPCALFLRHNAVLLLVYTHRALYSRAGLFHFRFSDLCHPASEILRTAKANGSWFLARRDIWNKIVRA